MKVGSLFSGIGGIDLGLERAGFKIKWQCEQDPWCRRLLTQHWPEIPKYEDVQTLDAATVEPVDLLAGGFPCQDLSIAGKRAGIKAGTRSGLWLEFARLIRTLRPRYVLVENVSGLLVNHALGRVLGDLAECGYDAEWQVLSAAAFGTPHYRKRVWIVAYPTSARFQGGFAFREAPKIPTHGNANQESPWSSRRGHMASDAALVRVPHGIPHRMDRIKGLGNAVVPQIVTWVGERIIEHAKWRVEL